VLPVRIDPARPGALPPGVVVPPARMALVRGGRPLKRWRYVAAFSDAFMLCAAVVRIGPVRQEFWAVWRSMTPSPCASAWPVGSVPVNVPNGAT